MLRHTVRFALNPLSHENGRLERFWSIGRLMGGGGGLDFFLERLLSMSWGGGTHHGQ